MNFEGHNPFPSDESERSDDERRRGWEAGFDRVERRSFRQINPRYRVIGNTGIVWGHVRITVDLKDGPPVTEYRRFTHAYVREGSEWKLVLYHSSATPTEDGSHVFFTALEPATGQELWRTHGTAAGTVLVKDIFPGAPAPFPSLLPPSTGRCSSAHAYVLRASQGQLDKFPVRRHSYGRGPQGREGFIFGGAQTS